MTILLTIFLTLRRSLLLLAALLALGPTEAAQAQFVAGDVLVTRGETVRVTLPDGADRLLATYRAGSRVLAETDTLAATGDGVVTWTPRQAGVVNLTVPGPGAPAQNVSVRFRATPTGGVAVLLLAGFVLFGGATFAFRKLFEND